MKPQAAPRLGSMQPAGVPWTFAYQLFDDYPVIYEQHLRVSEIDRIAMQVAAARLHSLVTIRTWVVALAGLVEVGEGTVQQVIGQSLTDSSALEVWLSSYQRNGHLTSAFKRHSLLPDQTAARVQETSREIVKAGSKVVVVKLKIDPRLKMAIWIILFAFVMSAACLLVGFVTENGTIGMALAAMTISFGTAVLQALEWLYPSP